ncbi:MAG: SRPBCC domain-containing protein [Pseudomonadota bacterium]
MPNPATAEKEGARTLVVTRDFEAPRGLIWRAFTNADALRKWLIGPPGWDMIVCEMDVRTGGGYRWRWRHPSDGEFGFTGTYAAVEDQQSLEDEQVYDSATHGVPMTKTVENKLVFEDFGQGTRVVSRMTFPTGEAVDQAVASGMTQGMEISYAKLDALIADGAV